MITSQLASHLVGGLSPTFENVWRVGYSGTNAIYFASRLLNNITEQEQNITPFLIFLDSKFPLATVISAEVASIPGSDDCVVCILFFLREG